MANATAVTTNAAFAKNATPEIFTRVAYEPVRNWKQIWYGLLHEGCAVTKRRKYDLRADVKDERLVFCHQIHRYF
jgi:hypothetical protein